MKQLTVADSGIVPTYPNPSLSDKNTTPITCKQDWLQSRGKI